MGAIIDPSEAILELGLSVTITDEQRAIVASSIRKAEAAVRRYLKYDPAQAIRTEFYLTMDHHGGHGAGVWESDGTQAFFRRQSTAVGDELQVQHLPVRQTDADGNNAIDLRVDFNGRFGTQAGSFAAETQKLEGTDFWPTYDGRDAAGIELDRSGIIRSFGRWPSEPGSVRITYVGGYTPAELRGTSEDAAGAVLVDASPIWDAVLDETIRRFTKAFTRRQRGRVAIGTGALTGERLGDYSYTADGSTLRTLVDGNFDIMPETAAKLSDFVNMGWALEG